VERVPRAGRILAKSNRAFPREGSYFGTTEQFPFFELLSP
jgi:hypothetical protein